jgi:hypothetical protein
MIHEIREGEKVICTSEDFRVDPAAFICLNITTYGGGDNYIWHSAKEAAIKGQKLSDFSE